MSFVHLHNHFDYSILDGFTRVATGVATTAALGQPAMAMTDHGNLAGAFYFYQECIANGIKPIIGMEAYVAPLSMSHKAAVRWGTEEQRHLDVGRGGAHTHLTILAMDSEGLRNLYRLYALSFSEGFWYKQRIDRESLIRHNRGLIVLTGCLGSELQTRLKLGHRSEARNYLGEMREAFGDRLYIEIMDHGIADEIPINPQLIDLSRSLGIPLVATNDSHYSAVGDSFAHDALVCVQSGQRIEGVRRFKFDGEGYYLKSSVEMRSIFAEIPGACDSTLEISERVGDYREVFDATLKLPKYSDHEDEDLAIMATDGLRDRGLATPQHFKQLDYELETVAALGFSGYILTQHKAMEAGRSVGAIFGPGRGSATGSLINYALSITGLDPVANGLVFERFINPERVSLPDIDLDTSERTIERFRTAIADVFGRDKVARLGTLSTIGAKAAIKDAARVLGLQVATAEELIRFLPPMKRGRAPSLAEIGKYPQYLSPIYELAAQLEGSIRGMSQHASGMVISNEPLADQLPIWISDNGKGEPTTAYTMDQVEKLGLIKYDFLTLRNLDIIDDTLKMIGKDWSWLPQDTMDCVDPLVLKLFADGETIGVFQSDSHLMRDIYRKVRVSSFEDISAVLALARPGPRDSGGPEKFSDRKHGRARVDYIHPELEEAVKPVLESTYGLIVYQEQVLDILRNVGDYSYATADVIFNAMRKKDAAKMAAAKPEFLERLGKRGYGLEATLRLWETLVPFSDYSFNKAHTAAYGLVAYWTAVLKVHFPIEYMASLLTSTADDPKRTPVYLEEAERMGIPILTPDINSSGNGWSASKEGLRYGLSTIGGVGPNALAAILKGRPYSTLDSFFTRADRKVLNSGVLRALIQSGALDTLCCHRESLYDSAEHLGSREVARRQRQAAGESPTVSVGYGVRATGRDDALRAKWEQSVLGVILTHPTVTLEASRWLTEIELEYLRDTFRSHAGRSTVRLRVGTAEIGTGVRVSWTDKLQRAVTAMGVLKWQ